MDSYILITNVAVCINLLILLAILISSNISLLFGIWIYRTIGQIIGKCIVYSIRYIYLEYEKKGATNLESDKVI